jgi:peptidoglycan/xylan/chitin deacetylase (PgdA/CDA1 family)
MGSLRYAILRGGLEVVAASRIGWLVRRLSRARGLIFTLHRVLPDDPADFAPNAILQVKPDFLAFAIARVRKLGYETVSIGEAVRRIEATRPEKPFAVFTFDDGYRDNLRYALPILRKLQCPFTLYVATALADGVGEVWWQAIEDIIAAQDAISVIYRGETTLMPCATLAEKAATFEELYCRLRAMPEPERVAVVRDLAKAYGFDLSAHCRDLIMDWRELRTFADEPLCTIGAHTVHHHELSKLPADVVRSEIEQSARVLKAQFGRDPEHLSYPIGSAVAAGPREFAIARDLGFRSAVTTRPGGLYARHRAALTALPRVSLNGLFQARRFVDVFATPDLFRLIRS